MRRRRLLETVGTGAGLALAGCITQDNGGESSDDGGTTSGEVEGALTVATYASFLDAPSTSPGEWIKATFEEEHPDATIEWESPENELNHYIERRAGGGEIDADMYVGLNVDDLIRVDDTLDEALFEPIEREGIENADAIDPVLEFDPEDRALPYDTGYVTLVYDENEVDEPTSLGDLLEPEYEGALLAQNAQGSTPGQAFLLWTIESFGEGGYLDYWQDLVENDVRILGSWWDTYSAYLEEERPMIVSYSTDQVYASADGHDLARHQVAFPEGEAYANPEGMAMFDGADETLARTFMEFVLSPEAQAEIATLNVQFPATTHAELDEEFEQYAYEPDDTVSFGYEELQGNLDGWVDDWAQEIAQS